MQLNDEFLEEPSSFFKAVDIASTRMPMNETVRRFERDNEIQLLIKQELDGLGQKQFINLAKTAQQSRIALALYVGDGLVVKIIPEPYLSMAKDVIFHLPAISTTRVSSQSNTFVINTYPWVSTGRVTQNDVECLRAKINSVGMDFHQMDGFPKNVHRMPDRKGTLVGIDSDMYGFMQGGSRITDGMRQQWHAYVHALFPIYHNGIINPQNEHTNFAAVSMHDPSRENISFELKDEEVEKPPLASGSVDVPVWHGPEF